MKTRLISLLMAGAIIIACDPVEEDSPSLDFGEADTELEKPANPIGDPLTPNESCTRLEEIGDELSDILKPDSQKELLAVIDEFYVVSEDLEIEYRGYIEEAMKSLLDPMRQVANLDVKAAADYASVHETYIYALDQVSGIYSHNGSEWSYKESADKLEFNFNVGGQSTTIAVVPSGQEYDYSYTYDYENWIWDGDAQETVKVPCKETITIKVPGKIEASVVKGGKTLASLLIEGQYKVASQEPIITNVNLVMGSYDVKVGAILSTSELSERVVFSVDGKIILNAKAEAEGTFNLDPMYYDIEDEPASVSAFIGVSNAEFVTKILDLRIAANCNNIQKLEKDARDLEATIDDHESNTAYEVGTPYSLSQDFVKKVCKLFNEGVNVEASYADGPVFATLGLKAQFYEDLYYYDKYEQGGTSSWDSDGDGIDDKFEIYYNGKEVYVDGYQPLPVLNFVDGGSFSIEEFFTTNESKFTNIIDDFMNLAELYMNCLPNINSDNEIL